ncbi:prepilin peptidase [Streptomyces sp. 7N604]|uniref:prepilin peptidase n=1 Tax=Streptomyces sp. 7N604 TaxID=3457415 RepID=UPI003FCF15B2
MHLLLIVLAAAFGGVAGLLVPRAVYRLAVEPGEPWRAACPAGHALTGAARGWLGLARCPVCTRVGAEPAAERGGTRNTGRPGPGALPETADADTGSVPTAAARADADAPPTTRAWPARRGGWYGPGRAATAVGAALACGALAAATGPRPELAVWLLLVPFLLVLALVDRAVHRLPDVLTLTLPGAAAALLGAAAPLPGHAGSWAGALLGGLGLGGAYLVLFLIHPSGMGFGDVKLALTLGVALGWYGWPVLFAGAFASFLLGALYGAGLLLTRRAGRKAALPFGPFMISGALLGVLLGGIGAA